jgi:hypothetical protein
VFCSFCGSHDSLSKCFLSRHDRRRTRNVSVFHCVRFFFFRRRGQGRRLAFTMTSQTSTVQSCDAPTIRAFPHRTGAMSSKSSILLNRTHRRHLLVGPPGVAAFGRRRVGALLAARPTPPAKCYFRRDAARHGGQRRASRWTCHFWA